jgi:hypothetical protein
MSTVMYCDDSITHEARSPLDLWLSVRGFLRAKLGFGPPLKTRRFFAALRHAELVRLANAARRRAAAKHVCKAFAAGHLEVCSLADAAGDVDA